METRTGRILIGVSTIVLVIIMIIFVDYKTILENLYKISLIGILLFALTYTTAFVFRTYKLKLIILNSPLLNIQYIFNPSILSILIILGVFSFFLIALDLIV